MTEPLKSRVRKFTYFIGIDVSKNELDYAVMQGKDLLFHQEGKNGPDDIVAFLTKLKTLPGFTMTKAVFCMEHTGFYGNHLLFTLKKLKANVVLENPLLVKKFLELTRGKNDKADAIQIASYAHKNRDELRLWVWRRPVLVELTSLFGLRNRLLTTAVALKTPLKEQEQFIKNHIQKQSVRLCSKSLAAVHADLLNIDLKIDRLINSDERLKRLAELIRSVPSIGRVTAIRILVSTNEFRDINDPKKFACYAGVAPFKIESGQVKRRARISHFANKKMKALLHLCAINASRFDEGIKAYYIRKTQVEGKPKLAVLNAIRYKLIVRIFACVNQNRSFEKNYVRPKKLTASGLIICEV
ncbi:MAG: family transposase [Mucilaginibacter sp.]|nr:family transposase [Mucilaginibacter sp.]